MRKRKKKKAIDARGRGVVQFTAEVRLVGIDDDNWQLEILTAGKDRDGNEVERWKRAGYYSKTRSGLAAAVQRALEVELRRGPGHDIESWIEVHDRFLADLAALVRGVAVAR